MTCEEKLRKLHNNLRQKIGSLSTYTLFRLALERTEENLSTKVILSESALILKGLSKDECKNLIEQLKDIITASFGSITAELLLEGIWE